MNKSFYYLNIAGSFMLAVFLLMYAVHANNRLANAHAHRGAESHIRHVVHDICVVYHREGMGHAQRYLIEKLDNPEYATDEELVSAFIESCSYQIEKAQIYTAGYPFVAFLVGFDDGQTYSVIVKYDNGYFSIPRDFRIWLIRAH